MDREPAAGLRFFGLKKGPLEVVFIRSPCIGVGEAAGRAGQLAGNGPETLRLCDVYCRGQSGSGLRQLFGIA